MCYVTMNFTMALGTGHLLVLYYLLFLSFCLTQAHYAFCFEVVNTFVDSFETYANFKEVV